jgi:hypothetical protein
MSAPPKAPILQEAIENSTNTWQQNLGSLFSCAKDRFPDVVWDCIGHEDQKDNDVEQVFCHKGLFYRPFTHLCLHHNPPHTVLSYL